MTFFLPQSKGLQYFLPLAACLFFTAFASTAFADTVATEEWQISADKIIRFEDPQSVIAEGNIVLVKKELLPPKTKKKSDVSTDWDLLLEEKEPSKEVTQEDVAGSTTPQYKTKVTIKADWAAYDVTLGIIKARGNVSVISGGERLFADAGEVNLTRETGTFSDAVILRKEHDLHFEGKTIEKTGFNTYHVKDGWVITCKVEDGETPPWSFSSAEATIKEGGYAVLKHAKFKIKGVPILYTPYFIVPVKNTRQTGLLFPEFSSSDNSGFGFNLPFFYAISDSTDLTFYPEYLTKRGFMPGLEFRYIRNESNKGMVMGSYLKDDLSDPSETEYYQETDFTHTNDDRYWVRGKVDHDFGDNWLSRIDMDIVSDRDYLTEFNYGTTGFKKTHNRFLETFGRGFENKTDDQRKNTAKILRSWDGMALEANLLAINDVRINETTPTPLWKLPSVDFSGVLPVRNTSFTFDWDTDYVNYWREDGVGAHRFDLFPRISAPLPLGPYLESRAEVGLRETFYVVETYGDSTWSKGDSPSRFLYNIHAEVGTTLARDFTLGTDAYSNLSHNMRPYVEYDYLPEEDQTDLPSFDSVDRIDEENKITYGIDNFFNLFSTNTQGTSSLARDYGYFKIKQSYDFRSEVSDEPFSAVNLKMGWKPLRQLDIFYKTDIDVYGDGFITHSFESKYLNGRGDIFELEYRLNDDDDVEQINAYIKAQVLSNILAAAYLEHSISESETNEAALSLTYQALCWSMEVKSGYTPSDTSITVIFHLANIGTPFGLNLL